MGNGSRTTSGTLTTAVSTLRAWPWRPFSPKASPWSLASTSTLFASRPRASRARRTRESASSTQRTALL